MPAPSPTWNLVRCYGTWNNQDGTKKAGAFKVTVPQRVANNTDDVMIPAGVFATGGLNTLAGPSLDIQIPATDDPDITPHDWVIVVDVNFNDGSAGERFNLQPSVTGGAVNLRAVVWPSVEPLPGNLIYRGVPGGLAELDVDGDVVDAAGNKVTGGGGGGVTTNASLLTSGTLAIARIADGSITDVKMANPKANLASPTFTGTVRVPAPTIPLAAATKAYVDSVTTGLSNYQRVEKAATTARTSTTTVAADPELSLPVEANSLYTINALLHYDAAIAGGLTVRVNGPSGAVLFGIGDGVAASNAATTLATATTGLWAHRTISASPGPVGACGPGVTCTWRLTGAVTVNATAGTVSIGWAQATSSGTATNVLSRSELALTKVGTQSQVFGSQPFGTTPFGGSA